MLHGASEGKTEKKANRSHQKLTVFHLTTVLLSSYLDYIFWASHFLQQCVRVCCAYVLCVPQVPWLGKTFSSHLWVFPHHWPFYLLLSQELQLVREIPARVTGV